MFSSKLSIRECTLASARRASRLNSWHRPRPKARQSALAGAVRRVAMEGLEDRRLLAVAAPIDFPAADLPVVIPDDATVSSTIPVSNVPGRITDVNVTVTIAHRYDPDISITLVSPSGTRVPLALATTGGTGGVYYGYYDNFTNTTFDDEALRPLPTTNPTPGSYVYGPFTGSYQPATPLASLYGEQPNGNWRLEVNDSPLVNLVYYGYTNAITSWTLSVAGGAEYTTAHDTPLLPLTDLATTSASINVSAVQGILYDVDVRLHLSHENVSDLRAFLVSPAGTRVELFSNVGGLGDHFINTGFDDSSTNDITLGNAPFQAVFKPVGSLASLANENPNGTWKLEVSDDVAGVEGSLNNWAISLTTVPGSAQIAGYTFLDTNGNGVRDTDLITGTQPDVVFAIDVSTYAEWLTITGSPVGDVNNDLYADTLLDAELAAFQALNQDLIDRGLGTTAQVAIVVYGTTAANVDMDPAAAGVQLATTPSADADADGVPDVVQILATIQGGHNGVGYNRLFESLLQQTSSTFSNLGTATGNGNLVMVSGGYTYYGTIDDYTDDLATLTGSGAHIRAFGIGRYTTLADLLPFDATATMYATSDEFLAAFGGKGGPGVNYLETPLAGWSVFLDTNQNGLWDSGYEPQALSDDSGFYGFYGLPAGTYSVVEQPPADWNPTLPASGQRDITLAAGQAVSSHFGNREARGTVSGFAWDDANGNGIRDTNLVMGARPDLVLVLDASSSVLAPFAGTPVGDVNGDMFFNTLLDAQLAGLIALNQDLIARGLGSSARVGVVVYGDIAVGLDMDPGLPGIQVIASPAADSDSNGMGDVEQVLRSVQLGLPLVGTGTNFEAALQESLNIFNGLSLSNANTRNLLFLTDGVPTTGGGFIDEVTMLSNAAVSNIRAFGLGASASQAALQQIDPAAALFANTDSFIAPMSGAADGLNVLYVEAGLEGQTIYADLDANGVFDAATEPSTVTDVNGNYSLADLLAGAYTIRQVTDGGWSLTTPTGGAWAVTVAAGQVVGGKNMGNSPASSASGQVFQDLNGDGIRSNFEPVVANATVYADLNGNARLDAGEPAAVSDAWGAYAMPTLAPGSYSLRLVTPAGLRVHYPSGGVYNLTLATGENRVNLNFALGAAAAAQAPRIEVRGSGRLIANKSIEVSGANQTDCGRVFLTNGSIVRTYTIVNTGQGGLLLTSPVKIVSPFKGDFKIITQPPRTIKPGGSATLRVRFDPTGLGVRSAQVVIASNDSAHSPYKFVIRGTGVKGSQAAKKKSLKKASNRNDAVLKSAKVFSAKKRIEDVLGRAWANDPLAR